MLVTEFAPAKVNLLLAVHGPREDGFHDLTSAVLQVGYGDELEIGFSEGPGDELVCSDPELGTGPDNLVLRAVAVFREETGLRESFAIRLAKRLPVGAGLGGGSSDATATLRGLNRLCNAGWDDRRIAEVAARLGSDCALFVDPQPKLIRGRGELLERWERPPGLEEGRRIWIFRPPFAVGTGWAYAQLRANPQGYIRAEEAEERLVAAASGQLELLLVNSFEPLVATKYLALRCILDRLRSQPGVLPLLSGSGSAVFFLAPDDATGRACLAEIRDLFGGSGFFIESLIL